MEAVFKVVAWSFRAMLLGVYPELDHNDELLTGNRLKLAGKPLRFRGACIAKCGDWDWYKAALGLHGWQGEGPKGKICWLCDASLHRPETYAFDFSLSAGWRNTRSTMKSFWEENYNQGRYVSPLWQIPGLRIEHVIPDLMHCCCLGILQYASGNAMWEVFVFLGGVMTRASDAVGRLFEHVQASSQGHGSSN